MCEKKLVKVILLITFLNVIFAASDVENCDLQCEENNNKPVCVLNKKDICFRWLPSKCDMDRIKCLSKIDYAIYIDIYCDLEAFMCKDQPIFQSPPLDNKQTQESNP